MSTTVSYKGNTIATVENNTKTLTTAGKYLEADVVLTDVTSGGGGGFTYTITLENAGHSVRGYVQLNGEGDTYYSKNTEIEFTKGDFLRICTGASSGTIYVDDVIVEYNDSGTATYDYTLPDHDVSVKFTPNVVGYAYVNFPTLVITTDGSYDVSDYAKADVAVGGYTATITHTVGSSYAKPYIKVNGENPSYYKNGETFKFFDGDTFSVYLAGTSDGGSLYLNGTLIRNSGLNAETYVWTPPSCDISIVLETTASGRVYVTTQTMNITSNGTYEIPHYGYITVNV